MDFRLPSENFNVRSFQVLLERFELLGSRANPKNRKMQLVVQAAACIEQLQISDQKLCLRNTKLRLNFKAVADSSPPDAAGKSGLKLSALR